ncbi:glycosyltransferase family 2 protein [Rubrivirga sp. S365]|uniref:Glycosyltransferase family 2 protein n=1 Tax=Rubrivirga litoralis TaxID=3075598 RepID=A0ABU3BSG4_9BACT|nr:MULTISPECIES: glycosyltransferase family 2 protein [unclassified Rubrivirga]MDT0632222.1 glycosyltransferase family 2 protein [Rubrivirga sp. F394]MDT7856832.1 glycosyltransferase family 2 protein [Rubrivirga sp. S365]
MLPDAPAVSVVVTCSGSRARVERTVQSVLSQTYAPTEVLCVSVGPDGECPALDALPAEHAVWWRVVGEGAAVSDSRAVGFGEARGDYVQFLDAGDVIEPDKLARQVEAAQETGADLVAGSYRHVSSGGKAAHRRAGGEPPWLALFHDRLGSTASNLWRREAVRSADAVPAPRSRDAWVRMLTAGAVVAYADEEQTTVYAWSNTEAERAALERDVRELTAALNHCRTHGILSPEETEAAREAVFAHVRRLADVDFSAGTAAYRRAFPDGYVPSVSKANTWSYVAVLKAAGFGAAERLRRVKPVLDREVTGRYRSLASLEKAWRRYSGERPSKAQSWARTARVLAAPEKVLLFYPEVPRPYAVLYKLAVLAGYRMTSDPEGPCDAVFLWDDETRSAVGPFRNDEAAINLRCTDISKEHVSAVFEGAFGYPVEVDPTTYEGRVVKKSDENATHDGEVIDCPISADLVFPGYVYQKAIDNRRDDAEGFYEYRVPVFRGGAPVVYVKYRPVGARFKAFDGAEVVAPESVFSEEERSQIVAFTQALDMEYGELDVLRDRADGRIYVVDANKTPSGPSRGFDLEQSVKALHALLPAFEALIAESARRLPRAAKPGGQARRQNGPLARVLSGVQGAVGAGRRP